MSNQSTTRKTRRHIRQWHAPLKGCSGSLLILNSKHNSDTDRRWARLHLTPPARKQALLTTQSSSLRCESAAEHHIAEQYSKTGRTKLQKDLRRSDRSCNTCQDFLMIPSLWAAALETERRRFSKVILASNVTPNITRSAETLPQRVFRLTPGNTGLPRVGFFVSLTATCVTRCYPVAIETRLLC